MQRLNRLPVLQRLVGTDVNVDELDYLMKRLDSFQRTEIAKFQGMSEVLDLRSVSDLINLTFCCDQVTVITDFRNLSSVGKNHYLTVHGGCAPSSEIVSLDGQKLADDLIRKETGHITPYGVIYDNGMELKQEYKGTAFPLYSYHPQEMVVGVSPAGQTDRETLMMLPMAEKELERAMRRNGMSIHERVTVRFNEVTDFALFKTAVKFSRNDMRSINAFVKLVSPLDGPEIETWQAAVNYVGVRSMEEFLAVGRNLDLFYYCFDVSIPEEYGKRIIQESGHFDYDPNLDAYYDYRKYGEDRIRQEQGVFLEHGYFVYLGEQPFWELIQEQEQNRQLCPPKALDFGGHLARCGYFTVDAVTGEFEVTADETSFVSLLITDGSGTLHCGGEQVTFRKGDSLFLPAGSGTFSIKGAYQALQTTV